MESYRDVHEQGSTRTLLNNVMTTN
jgi:hypothetical protein